MIIPESHIFYIVSPCFPPKNGKHPLSSGRCPSLGGPGRRESLLRRRGQAPGAQRVVPAKPGGPGGPGSAAVEKRNTVGCRHGWLVDDDYN